MGIGKLTRKGNAFANVVASGVASNTITPGRTLNNVQLKLGGTSLTKAMLSLIKIKANGRTIIEATGSQLDKLNAYRGQSTNAAFLDIPFSERAGLTEFDRAVGAFDTSKGIASLTSEVTIAGATAPTLDMILTEQGPQVDKNGDYAPFAGVIAKVLRYPFSTSVGGKLPVNLPFGPDTGAIIKRIHVEHTGNMTGVDIKQDGVVIHESLKAENEYEQSRWGRVPQTNMYTVDFMVDGNVSKALDTRTSRFLEVWPTFSAGDSGFVIVEYLDRLENL